MDVSRLTIGEDTSSGVSIYLSFDSNSTMSSVAYKTMEAIGDFSTVSAMELDEVEESTESHQNSTLEAANESHLKTVKKAEVMPLGTASALRTLPKNILQGYKAISSTPTKAQLLRSVDIMRGSEAERGMDLGVAFMGLEDEKNAIFNDENKENAVPDIEVSTLSTSGEIATSVIEKKQTTLTTTAEQSMKISEEMASETSLEAKVAATPSTLPNKSGPVDEKKDLPSTSGLRKPKTGIPQKKNNRKSVCEPNLNTNRPSRIASNLNRRTSLALNQKLAKNDISDIPQLLDKMLKISSKSTNKKDNTSADNENRKPRLTAGLTESSTLLLAEKRPFSFTQRMSIVVKTTLNSPARKMARKSLLTNGQPTGALGRRSVLTTANGNASKNVRRSVMPPQRRSMLPTSAQARKAIENVEPTKKLDQANEATNKQMQPILEQAEAEKKQKKSTTATKAKKESIAKSTTTFNCSVCSRQFSIKALLDAHKHSHKDDTPPPPPPPQAASNLHKITSTVTANSITNNTPNQCKYCDKKFAIVRALNIHLIQNCPKIPPGEKKKLHCTELNHVEKAQLPPVFTNSSGVAPTKMLPKSRSNLSDKKMSSAETLIKKQEINTIPQDFANAAGDTATQMAPPQSTSKLTKKKAAAHAGVYRTPSKSVPCHLCKQSFKSILDYTNHSMAMHSTHSSNLQVPHSKNRKMMDHCVKQSENN